MEDLDAPRCSPASAEAILHTLLAFGFEHDGPVVYQSRRLDLYAAHFERLRAAGLTFPCACTRSEIRGFEDRYPGTCRDGLNGRPARAYRLLVSAKPIVFTDRLQGQISANLEADCGDFVLRRADGVWAYQLAVVVDDFLQGVNNVVRGADLLDSTPRQILLQRHLGFPTPAYLHIPIAAGESGQKLSKQTLAPPLDPLRPVPALEAALRFLGHPPPAALANCSLGELWSWATLAWRPDRIPPQRSLPAF